MGCINHCICDCVQEKLDGVAELCSWARSRRTWIMNIRDIV